MIRTRSVKIQRNSDIRLFELLHGWCWQDWRVTGPVDYVGGIVEAIGIYWSLKLNSTKIFPLFGWGAYFYKVLILSSHFLKVGMKIWSLVNSGTTIKKWRIQSCWNLFGLPLFTTCWNTILYVFFMPMPRHALRERIWLLLVHQQNWKLESHLVMWGI